MNNKPVVMSILIINDENLVFIEIMFYKRQKWESVSSFTIFCDIFPFVVSMARNIQLIWFLRERERKREREKHDYLYIIIKFFLILLFSNYYFNLIYIYIFI